MKSYWIKKKEVLKLIKQIKKFDWMLEIKFLYYAGAGW